MPEEKLYDIASIQKHKAMKLLAIRSCMRLSSQTARPAIAA
jgi:hypothetical protein